jgi:S1-C subfamily serine protease
MMDSITGVPTMLPLTLLLLVAPAADAPKKAYIGVQMSVAAKPSEAIIQIVLKDSPAMKAGLKGGDVLLTSMASSSTASGPPSISSAP